MTSHDYDLAIIGTGSAAFAAAIRASGIGARCALIERGAIGGTCVNVGCVPSKTLLAAAHLRHAAATNPFLGAPTSAGDVDLPALIAQKDELVAELRQAKYLDLAATYGFDIIQASARFADDSTLLLGDGHRLWAPAYLVATGAEPAVPDLPGLEPAGYLTSTTAMNLERVPRRLVVIGGGFVGMEQGQLFAQLGASVTIIGRLAPRADPEMARRMTDIFGCRRHHGPGRSGHRRRTRTGPGRPCGPHRGRAPRRRRRDPGRHRPLPPGRRSRPHPRRHRPGWPRLHQGRREPADDEPRGLRGGRCRRRPAVRLRGRGPGRGVAAENAVGGGAGAVDYHGLPTVIFTLPSLASAGLTEPEALAAGHRCECRVVELTNVPRAIVKRDTRGAIKIVIDRDSHNVLGVHAIAREAGEMMLAATYAIKFGLTVEQMADTWASYLTMSEGLKLTAQSFHRDIKQLSCCAA